MIPSLQDHSEGCCIVAWIESVNFLYWSTLSLFFSFHPCPILGSVRVLHTPKKFGLFTRMGYLNFPNARCFWSAEVLIGTFSVSEMNCTQSWVAAFGLIWIRWWWLFLRLHISVSDVTLTHAKTCLVGFFFYFKWRIFTSFVFCHLLMENYCACLSYRDFSFLQEKAQT